MDEMYTSFRIDIHNRLKSSINAAINCKIDEEKDILYVSIKRLGVSYDTTIKGCSNIIKDGEDGIDKCLTKIVNSYRSFINHKFFY